MEKEQQGTPISLGDRDLLQTTGSERSFGPTKKTQFFFNKQCLKDSTLQSAWVWSRVKFSVLILRALHV